MPRGSSFLLVLAAGVYLCSPAQQEQTPPEDPSLPSWLRLASFFYPWELLSHGLSLEQRNIT